MQPEGADAQGGGGGRMEPPAGDAAHHSQTFKLRFASQREPGRSYVSLVKPLGLPATVTGSPYSRRGEPAALEAAALEAAALEAAALEAAALARVRRMFRQGPRDKYDTPALSSHEYGWYETADDATRGDRRLHHHIRDSWWLRTRVRILAADRALNKQP